MKLITIITEIFIYYKLLLSIIIKEEKIMRLIITKHARDQMFDRGIDEDQIIRAIKRGAKTRQTDGYITTYTYVRIAYKKIGKGQSI